MSSASSARLPPPPNNPTLTIQGRLRQVQILATTAPQLTVATEGDMQNFREALIFGFCGLG